VTWWDKLLAVVYFLALIVVQCYWHRALIKYDKPVKHGWHSLIYAVAASFMVYFFWPYWWQVALLAFAERLAFFDPILNRLRYRPFFYNGAGGSIQDKLENYLRAPWIRILKIFYILLFIILLIIIK
jgi:hypothetical protein